MVWNRGFIPFPEAAVAFGSAKQRTKHANAECDEEHWPQNAVHYSHLITLRTMLDWKHLIKGFGIVVTCVFRIKLAIIIPKAFHIIIVIGPLRTVLNTALQDKKKLKLSEEFNRSSAISAITSPFYYYYYYYYYY